MNHMEYAYIGGYTTEKRGGLGHGGIAVYRRKDKSDCWVKIQSLEQINPSFLCFGFQQTKLYAVHSDVGTVSSYQIDPETGEIQLLNNKKIGFSNGVYITVSQDDRFLIVSGAGKSGSAIISLCLNEDGSLGDIRDIAIPNGTVGPLKAQTHPTVHQALFDPSDQYVIEVDKGLDAINTFSFDTTGTLTQVASHLCRAGSCPRHIAFHPSNCHAYILTEWIGTVEVAKYENGRFSAEAIYPTLPIEYVGLLNRAAEIMIHPSGKYLYISNRADNSIAAFKINANGALSQIGWFRDHIAKPRYFTISKNGEELYCANEIGHSVTRYSIDESTGTLLYLDTPMIESAPACILLSLKHD